MQDLLNLGAESRVYVPSRARWNWRWRCHEEMLSLAASHWLQEVTNSTKFLVLANAPRLPMGSTDLEQATASQVYGCSSRGGRDRASNRAEYSPGRERSLSDRGSDWWEPRFPLRQAQLRDETAETARSQQSAALYYW